MMDISLWLDSAGLSGTSMSIIALILIVLGSMILILAGIITADIASTPNHCWNEEGFLLIKSKMLKRSAGMTGSGIFYILVGLAFQLLAIISILS